MGGSQFQLYRCTYLGEPLRSRSVLQFWFQASSAQRAKNAPPEHFSRAYGMRPPFRPPCYTDQKEKDAYASLLFGAGGGGRTRTVSLPTDFESASSANSNTPALFTCIFYHISYAFARYIFTFLLPHLTLFLLQFLLFVILFLLLLHMLHYCITGRTDLFFQL